MRIFLLSLLFTGSNFLAQNFCYTTERQNEWFSKHPELKESFENHKKTLSEKSTTSFQTHAPLAGKMLSAGIYTIPVVFHILHTGGGENISDAQVMDAVTILTRDFNAANADTSGVVAPFKHLIGNPQFDFVLATKDPNGNCTNGIVRHYDVNTDWTGNLQQYAYTWPAHKYLNIYVVRSMFAGAAGYTYLPGSGIPVAMDAIVILSNYVGSIGSGKLSLSRTLTHEVGHWFDLDHVWGGNNSPGVACGDDGVNDTPLTKGYTSCNLNTTVPCTQGIVENVQNYMEYAYCQRMYTIGQSNRMQTCITSPVNGRNNLSSPLNLQNTGVTNPGTNCAPDHAIVAAPTFTACSGRTLSLSSFTFNAAPTSYSWSADNGAVITNNTASSTPVLFTNTGLTHVSCLVANANGSSLKTITITVANGATQINANYSESFEASSIALPINWAVINPTTPSYKWSLINEASQGSNAMYVPGEMLSANSVEILQSPSYDFKHNQGAQFTFKFAYAMKNANFKDVFKVQASRNCGGSWTDVWSPSPSNLCQNSGGVSSPLFLPQPEQWKEKLLTQQPQFLPFFSEENVILRFYFQEDAGGVGYGNRFYLDEVNFQAPVGVNEFTKAVNLNVYPNPSSSEFNLSFQLSDPAKISFEVLSVSGALLLTQAEVTYYQGPHELKINTQSELAAGIYFIHLRMNGIKMSRKIIVN